LLAAFFGFLVLRLPVPNRMALAPGVMLALFCSFATLGWIGHRRGTQRRLWMVGATAMAALLIATAPGEITRLHQLTQRRAAMQRIMADLNTLGKSPAAQAALASCRTLTVGAPDIVPYTAYYLDRPLQRMAALTPSNGRNGAYLALTSLRAAQFVLGPQPERGIWVPAGFKPAAGDRSWRLYTRGC
jgi:hypothetical protein